MSQATAPPAVPPTQRLSAKATCYSGSAMPVCMQALVLPRTVTEGQLWASTVLLMSEGCVDSLQNRNKNYHFYLGKCVLETEMCYQVNCFAISFIHRKAEAAHPSSPVATGCQEDEPSPKGKCAITRNSCMVTINTVSPSDLGGSLKVQPLLNLRIWCHCGSCLTSQGCSNHLFLFPRPAFLCPSGLGPSIPLPILLVNSALPVPQHCPRFLDIMGKCMPIVERFQ